MKKFLQAAGLALPLLAGSAYAGDLDTLRVAQGLLEIFAKAGTTPGVPAGVASVTSDYALPALSDPTSQALINRFRGEVSTLESDAYIAQPPAKEWPCQPTEEQLRRMAGVPDPAMEEETRKLTIKAFRDQGMSPDAIPKISRENIQVIPISAQCKNGKLDGQVDVWSRVTNITDMQTQSSRMTMTMRAARHFAEGKEVGAVVLVTRTGENATTYKDPAMAKMMAKSQAIADGTRNVSVSYSTVDPSAGSAMFMIMPTFKPKGGFSTKLVVTYRVMTMLTLPNGKDRTNVLGFMGAQPSSKYSMKNGKQHGEYVSYAVLGDDGKVLMPEQHMCFQNGQQIQTVSCPSD